MLEIENFFPEVQLFPPDDGKHSDEYGRDFTSEAGTARMELAGSTKPALRFDFFDKPDWPVRQIKADTRAELIDAISDEELARKLASTVLLINQESE